VTGSALGELAGHGARLAAALSTTGWGRLVLVLVGGYVGAMGASAWWSGSEHAWVAVVIGAAFVALAAYGQWRTRREEGEQGRRTGGRKTVGGLVGLVLTLLAGALMLLRHRRRAKAGGTGASAPIEAPPPPTEPTEASSAAEAGRRGMRGLVAALPGIAWATLGGLFGGALRLGAVGLALGLVTVASARWWLELPGWLVWANLLVAPFVLAVAGAYIGTIRGFLAALASALVEGGVVPALYGLVRPVLVRVGSGIARRTDPLTRGEAVSRVHAHVQAVMRSNEAEPPRGVLDRFERNLAERTQTWLALASIATAADAPDRAAALADLEQRGIEGVEASLADAIVAAYRLQAFIALCIAAVLLCIPWAVFVATR
jgi:hypothetical protein